MAKREFIETREIVYVNAPISPILQGDSVHYEDIAFKAQIGRIHSFSEQDIIKPYLEKIRAEIEQLRLHKAQFLTNDNKVCVDSQEVLNILDKYKTESEGKE